MKINFYLSLKVVLCPVTTFSQWSTGGNTGAAGQWLGTNNAFPLTFKTNNTERGSFSSAGVFKVNGLSGTGNGLMMVSSTGEVSRLGFGAANEFLTGSGTWATMATATGWTLASGKITTTNKIGIGVSNPTSKLEVDGNGVFNGTVFAEHFSVGDASVVQGTLSLTNNMIVHGYDPIAGKNNEIFTTTQPYFIQSTAGYNNNTYINYNNTGKLGIGTNSPTAKMHLVGTSKFDGEATFTDVIRLGDGILKKGTWGTVPVISALGGDPLLDPNLSLWPSCVDSSAVNTVFNVDGLFTSSVDGAPQMFMGNNGIRNMIESSGRLEINSQCGSDVWICPGWSGNDVMLAQSGKVGIGTLHPRTKLDIKTGPFSLYLGDAVSASPLYASSYIGFNIYRNATEWSTGSDGVHNGGSVIYSNVIGDMFFTTVKNDTTGSAPQTGITDAAIHRANLYINAATGNVAIGTTCAPAGFRLAVDGRIICEEVKVKMSNGSGCWPDYVFAKDYNLPGIKQVEQYIKQQGHLPGFKSAKDIETNGVELSETIRLQQEKIEELTLYIIELNKRLEQLEKK